MLIGYARVSTDDQNLDLQRDALAQAGCERITEDRLSGAKAERPGLLAAEKSRLKDRQIWAVILRAENKGLIKKAKKGVYVWA